MIEASKPHLQIVTTPVCLMKAAEMTRQWGRVSLFAMTSGVRLALEGASRV